MAFPGLITVILNVSRIGAQTGILKKEQNSANIEYEKCRFFINEQCFASVVM